MYGAMQWRIQRGVREVHGPPFSSQLFIIHPKCKAIIKLLDSKIVELTPEEELVREKEQADEYKENVYRALTSIDKTLVVTSAPASSTAHVTTTPSMHVQSPTPLAAEEQSYQRSRYPDSVATS